MSGGLSPRGKVVGLSRCDWGVVFAPYSRRENVAGNLGTLGSSAVAATPAMFLQVRCNGVSARAGWNVCAGAVGTAYGVGYLWCYRLFKNWHEGPDKVGSVSKRGFTHTCARLRGTDRPPLWSPQMEGPWFDSVIGLDRRFIGLYH